MCGTSSRGQWFSKSTWSRDPHPATWGLLREGVTLMMGNSESGNFCRVRNSDTVMGVCSKAWLNWGVCGLKLGVPDMEKGLRSTGL